MYTSLTFLASSSSLLIEKKGNNDFYRCSFLIGGSSNERINEWIEESIIYDLILYYYRIMGIKRRLDWFALFNVVLRLHAATVLFIYYSTTWFWHSRITVLLYVMNALDYSTVQYSTAHSTILFYSRPTLNGLFCK